MDFFRFSVFFGFFLIFSGFFFGVRGFKKKDLNTVFEELFSLK